MREAISRGVHARGRLPRKRALQTGTGDEGDEGERGRQIRWLTQLGRETLIASALCEISSGSPCGAASHFKQSYLMFFVIDDYDAYSIDGRTANDVLR